MTNYFKLGPLALENMFIYSWYIHVHSALAATSLSGTEILVQFKKRALLGTFV